MLTGRAFGETSSQKKKRKKAKDALNSLTEITPGDLVVHQNHGIGRYAGIQRMAVQGVTKDYLRIEYDKKDVLYVPVTQLDLLSRYTAPGIRRMSSSAAWAGPSGQDPQEGARRYRADGQGTD